MTAYTQEERAHALTALMQRHGESIKRMCCVYLRDMHSAEDAAQETFIKAYTHIDKLLRGEIRSEKAWLSRIALNTCKDAMRSPWLRLMDRRRSIEDLPLATPPMHEDQLALTEAVAALPPKLKEIVLLHCYQGLTLRTCAQILGISAPTATRRLAQAASWLRIDLTEGG